MKLSRNQWLWGLWIISTIAMLAYLANVLLVSDDKRIFLPGETSHGHHQIEMACHSCHGESFTDKKTLQKSCMNCHGDQLKEAKDDHPKKKFTDPRNADRVAQLDARFCATCHSEHTPEITNTMGLTLPLDYCQKCHADIAEDRPSHEGMAFNTCADAGCHNYHDNRAIYEDFLAKHLHEPDMLDKQLIEMIPNTAEVAELLGQYPLDNYPLEKITEHDAPDTIKVDAKILHEWSSSNHAEKGVNCSACHQSQDDKTWVDKPRHTVCETCHENQMAGFLEGKHGMRLNVKKLETELSPMSPSMARIPMQDDAMEQFLGCSSCHASHTYDVQHAAVDGCLSCHNDDHSIAYKQSPHYELIKKETAGELPAGSGVSCAACHMPKVEKEYFYGEVIQVLAEHDQSDNLRPNEKMIRPICMQCHGLGFSINALADEDLIKKNFNGSPAVQIKSLELAEDRLKAPKDKTTNPKE